MCLCTMYMLLNIHVHTCVCLYMDARARTRARASTHTHGGMTHKVPERVTHEQAQASAYAFPTGKVDQSQSCYAHCFEVPAAALSLSLSQDADVAQHTSPPSPAHSFITGRAAWNMHAGPLPDHRRYLRCGGRVSIARPSPKGYRRQRHKRHRAHAISGTRYLGRGMSASTSGANGDGSV